MDSELLEDKKADVIVDNIRGSVSYMQESYYKEQ